MFEGHIARPLSEEIPEEHISGKLRVMTPKPSIVRDPDSTQAWLVGSGIASLAAAVHLIRDAKLPGSNIHILDRHANTGGGISSSGDAEHGFVLYPGSLPYFQTECIEDLLSVVPSTEGSDKSLLAAIREFELNTPPEKTAKTRFLRKGDQKIERSDASHLSIGPHNRLQLMKLMLESERTLGRQRIQDFFGDEFFATDFWTLWSTT